jgi:predicted TIM-barrel fold metal-dependent hydrolase
MIFDCHRHISAKTYDLGVVHSNFIFNSLEEYRQEAEEVRRGNSISLIFDLNDGGQFLESQYRSGAIQAFKIHSRRQKLKADDYSPILEKGIEWEVRLPIIVDAFYFGQDLEFQPSLPFIIQLARALPETPIVVAHAGGYRLLEYFFHLRELENIWLDLSFSLQYLADSSLRTDLKKVIKFWDRKRVMYGSDFPWSSAKMQADVLSNILDGLAFSDSEKHLLFYKNAADLYKVPIV